MRLANLFAVAVLALLTLGAPLLAEEAAPSSAAPAPAAPAAAKPALPGGGAGIGMGLAIVGVGIGIGLVGYAALSGIARQPEQAGAIQGAMYVLAGLVEGAGIIALILCLILGLG